jgi:hypothetical protein
MSACDRRYWGLVDCILVSFTPLRIVYLRTGTDADGIGSHVMILVAGTPAVVGA